jgi:hypothetical protein
MTATVRWTILTFLTVYGLWVLPGRTYLLSDTQIYVPMFDRLADPSLFGREIVAQRQHLSLTLYDEVAILGKWITGFDYEWILGAVQAICRLLGLYGLFLIGRACGLAEAPSLLVAAVGGFGATIIGPAVLTFEYEPVPRGFAVMLTMLAAGLAMLGRNRTAAIAAGVAFLFHAPAVVPFLIAFAVFQIWVRDFRPLVWVAAAIAIAAVFSWLQPGTIEKQAFFTQVDPAWEELQRKRAAYNWLSSWRPWFFWNYAINGLVAVAALWRIWPHLNIRARFYGAALPLIGLLSLPLGWVLMEHYRWALMAQVQPARSVLYTVFFAIVLSSSAALFAIRGGRWIESAFWWIPGLLTALHMFLWNGEWGPVKDFQMTALAVAATVAVGWWATRESDRRPLLAALAILLVPAFTGWIALDVLKRVNYRQFETPDLTSAAAWAGQNTAADAMFLLPELVNSLESGIFRARARRALFVDWKIGGQVNYSRELAFEWWRRVQMANDKTRTLESWRNEGVDYLVLKATTLFPGGREVFRNPKYAIYRINP